MTGFFDLIKLLLRLWDTIQSIIDNAKKRDGDNWDKRIIEGVQAYAKLQNAKTPEERDQAESDVSRNWFSK